jgi:AraC family transcriptional regulator
VARYVGVSKDHLTRCFRQQTGVTPMTYLTRYRVNQAKQLLATQEDSVAEIATMVGFASIAYFSRVFRREVGVSPRAYRQNGCTGP